MRAGWIVLLVLLVPTVAGSPWIAEVHPRARSGWATEFVTLKDPDGTTGLAGWSLDDGEGTIPLNGTVGPHRALRIVENRSQLRRWAGPAEVREIPYGTTAFRLANGGDTVRLVAPDGRIVDVVAFGDSEPGPGWNGTPLPRPAIDEILVRRGNDTDTATDFGGLRRPRFGQTDLAIPDRDAAVTMFAAPDRSHEEVLRFLRSASSRLVVNLYEMTHPRVGDELVAAHRRGVDVTVLLEGQPVGWNFTMPEPRPHLEPTRWRTWRAAQRQLAIVDRLRDAGIDVHRIGNHRYRFDHAKYAVADGRRVLVTSENWGLTGLPKDPSFGNRGFGAVVRDPALARDLEQVFRADADPDRPDVRPFAIAPADDAPIGAGTPRGPYRGDVPSYRTDRARVRPVVAPDQSGRLLEAIAAADERVRIMALDLDLRWDGADRMYDALADATDRGASIRVLVNDNPRYDEDQVRRVADELAPLGADVAGLRAGDPFVNLHAKLVVADDRVYVGSMNLNRNAFVNNREVGLLVDDPGAADWAVDIFRADWRRAHAVEGTGRLPRTWLAAAGIAAGIGLAVVAERLRRG